MRKIITLLLAICFVSVGCSQLKSRIKITEDKIVISEKIQFETGKATILPESHGLLDELANVFNDNPQIELVSIEGHTDSTGSAKGNQALSQERAQAVLDYLAGKGVAPDRMQAKGFGQAKPIASNDTEEGRAQNRRVELNILEQKPKGYKGTIQ